MKKKELFEMLDNGVSCEDRKLLLDYVVEKQMQEGWDQSNKGKPWSDDELRVILSFAPTKENCLLLARAFKRGYGSIEQIFRWATTDSNTIKNSIRNDDAFITQIKRIYRELGWRA